MGIVASALTPVSLSLVDGLMLCAAIGYGFVPFFALGTALGYLLNPRAALSVALLIFSSLVGVGGLWTGPIPCRTIDTVCLAIDADSHVGRALMVSHY